MTQPSGPILGAVHLDDGINTRFRWNEEIGLASPAARAVGSIQQTFGGPVRVMPSAVIYQPKDLDLPGYLLQVNGLAESYDRLARLYQLAGTAGTVSVLQVGALGMQVFPEPPTVERLKAHRVQTDFSMRATGVPGVWSALFGSYLGAAYEVVANGESLINTSAFALAAGASPTVTNAGTAATPLVLTVSVSGPRTTRFYIRCTAPGYTKRISLTPTAGGVVSVTEKDGLFVPPGASTLRYEEASGALITGTIASSIYGTRWRYEGLDDTLSDVSPVVLYNTRQMRAYAATSAFTTSAGLTLYGPDVPRFGNSGTYDAADAGLVVEPDRTNFMQRSQALATAPWSLAGAGATVTNDYDTAPDGTTTASRVQFTAASVGAVTQASPTLSANAFVLSFYSRRVGAVDQVAAVSLGALLASTDFTATANWQRFEYLVTATAASYTLNIRSATGAPAADILIWGVQLELAQGQTAANATSYIPTTSTTQRRLADIVGVRKLENLVAWSNRFDKTTASSTTRGLWYVSGGTVTTATLQAGPSGVTDAATLTAVGAVAGIQQRLLNGENLAGKTVVFSVWVRNSTSTPNSNAVLEIQEEGAGAGANQNALANLDDQWRRLTVQRKLSSGVTDVRIKILSGGTITYYFAHAHVAVASEGTYNLTSVSSTAISAPYIETAATPYQAQGAWTWPDWLTQNGYLEADICFGETANPNNRTTIILGANGNAFTPAIDGGTIYRSSGDGSASNIIRTNKTSSAGTAGPTYTPSSSLFDGAYHKFRAEWVNYTIAGTRTIQFRLYVDGVLQGTNSPAATTWARPPGLFASYQGTGQSFQTMKNIAIGSPTLPAGAIPEPY